MGQAETTMEEFNSEISGELEMMFKKADVPSLELNHLINKVAIGDAGQSVEELRHRVAKLEQSNSFLKASNEAHVEHLDAVVNNIMSERVDTEKEILQLKEVIQVGVANEIDLTDQLTTANMDLKRLGREFGKLLAAHHKAVGSDIRKGI